MKHYPNYYWNNYNRCYEEAQKYLNRYSFQKGNSTAYRYALNNNWLDDYTWFLPKEYTKETCLKEASKYKYFSDFRKKSSGAYAYAIRNNLLDELPLIRNKKPRNYWNYEKCFEIAKQFNKISDFSKKYPSAYNKTIKKKWINSFKWLKDDRINIVDGNIDLVYSYEFVKQKTVYIGRTLIRRKVDRDREHIFENNDVVSRFAKSNSIPVPKMKILESNLTIKNGVEKEAFYIDKYKNEGWNVLNKYKAGSIGSLAKGRWNKNNCYEEALKYTTKTDFRHKSNRAYEFARINGWLESYYWLGKKKRKLKGSIYNYDVCFKLAKECTHRADFEHKYPQAYKISKDNNWLNNFTWFKNGRCVRWENDKIYTYESCYNEAKKYEYYLDYFNNSNSSYRVAYKNGWINDYVWLKRNRRKRGFWNHETCYNEAKKYDKLVDFRYKSSRAYYVSMNNGWINEFNWLKRQRNYDS